MVFIFKINRIMMHLLRRQILINKCGVYTTQKTSLFRLNTDTETCLKITFDDGKCESHIFKLGECISGFICRKLFQFCILLIL